MVMLDVLERTHMEDQLQTPLFKARTERGLTQQQVADAVGVTQQAYAYWEKGTRFPRKESLMKLAEVLHTSVDFLTGKSDTLDTSPPEENTNYQSKNLIDFDTVEIDTDNLTADEKELLIRYRFYKEGRYKIPNQIFKLLGFKPSRTGRTTKDAIDDTDEGEITS